MARICIPYFTCAIIATRNELASILVECTVGQRKQMGPENLEEAEALLLVLKLFFNQLFDQLFKLGLSCL